MGLGACFGWHKEHSVLGYSIARSSAIAALQGSMACAMHVENSQVFLIGIPRSSG